MSAVALLGNHGQVIRCEADERGRGWWEQSPVERVALTDDDGHVLRMEAEAQLSPRELRRHRVR